MASGPEFASRCHKESERLPGIQSHDSDTADVNNAHSIVLSVSDPIQTANNAEPWRLPFGTIFIENAC